MQLFTKIESPICEVLSHKVLIAHLDDQLSDSYDFMPIFFVRSIHFVDNLQFCISGFIVGIKVGTRNPENDCFARVSVLLLNGFIEKCQTTKITIENDLSVGSSVEICRGLKVLYFVLEDGIFHDLRVGDINHGKGLFRLACVLKTANMKKQNAKNKQPFKPFWYNHYQNCLFLKFQLIHLYFFIQFLLFDQLNYLQNLQNFNFKLTKRSLKKWQLLDQIKLDTIKPQLINGFSCWLQFRTWGSSW